MAGASRVDVRRRPRTIFLVVLAFVSSVVVSGPPAVAAPAGGAAVPIDLSKGALFQSNCKTAVGCAHRNVETSASTFSSTDTSSELVQHILTLRVEGPWELSKGQNGGHLALAIDYDLINPSGTAGNVICATARHKGKFIHDCVRGLARSGRLTLPLSSHGADTLWIQFVAMPLSRGNRFEVRDPVIIEGSANEQNNNKDDKDGKKAPVPVNLEDGGLRQANCQIPVGCRHPDVRLDDGVFSSVVPAKPGGGQQPPSDNPNQPPQQQANAGGRLTLEVGVPDLKKGQRSLNFDHSMKGANGASPGVIKVWTIAGGTVLEAVIGKQGSGRSSLVIAKGAGSVDSVFFTFEPLAGGDGGSFEVSNVSYGHGGPTGEPLPIEESDTCDGCDPPASREDPCGEFLDTYYVEAADGREGRGYRCLSPDGHGFFGEGWWNDFDWGRYVHLGYFDSDTSAPDGVAIDFGWRRTLSVETSPGVFEDRTVEYGHRGPVGIQREVLGASRLRMTSLSGSWNEIWTLVPKGEPMPRFVGRLPWDGRCGANGLVPLASIYARTENRGRPRCALPTDLSDLGPDQARVSLPFVWYGAGYLDQPDGPASDLGEFDPEELARPHLGWLKSATSRAEGHFGVADRCVLPHASGCNVFDDVHIVTIPPGNDYYTEEVFHDGLVVEGPGTWGFYESDGRRIGEHWGPIPPGLASLPLPTPVCLDESSCPR